LKQKLVTDEREVQIIEQRCRALAGG
jgi:hypothetical protein